MAGHRTRSIVRLYFFASAVLVLDACALAVLFVNQRSLLYPASDRRSTAIEAGLTGFQDLILTTPGGERLVAWWKPPQPGKALNLYFHGNGGSLWNGRLRAQALTASRRGLLMVSYRATPARPARPRRRASTRTPARPMTG